MVFTDINDKNTDLIIFPRDLRVLGNLSAKIINP